MSAPVFVERVARLPEVLAVLQAYPEGLSLEVLAAQFGVDAQVMGEDLVTFMDVESWGWDMDLKIFRPPVIEFGVADDLDPDRDVFDDEFDDEEFSPATVVRVVHDSPSAGMGVELLSPGDLATVYTAAVALLDADPDDEELRAALAAIAETMFGEEAEQAGQPDPAEWNQQLPLFQRACAERLRVDIVYSRQWHIGISERTIEPLRLVQTRRGWEVDAGPPDAEGRLRTFLLSNIRSAEPREEGFEVPSHLESRLATQRTTTAVRVVLAQDARWAPDLYAERVDMVSEDDEEFVADLALLPPVAERVALLLLASGGSSRVLDPPSVVPAATEHVMALLAHHEANREAG